MGPGKVNGLIAQFLERIGLTLNGAPVASDERKMVVVTRVTTQAIANAGSGDTAVSWTGETRDDLGISAVGAGANTKVCTFTAAGVWDAKASIQWDANATGIRGCTLSLYNSSNVLKWAAPQYMNATSASGAYQSVAETFRVASGDYILVEIYQSSGGSLNLGGANPYTHCTLTRMGT